jgi:hypothetical protein
LHRVDSKNRLRELCLLDQTRLGFFVRDRISSYWLVSVTQKIKKDQNAINLSLSELMIFQGGTCTTHSVEDGLRSQLATQNIDWVQLMTVVYFTWSKLKKKRMHICTKVNGLFSNLQNWRVRLKKKGPMC